MKKFLSICMILGLVVVFAGSAAANLSDDLVACYPFNGNADDESSNGNHGTVYGATLTTDRFGNADSAYYFDGEDDYIIVPDHTALRLSNVDFTLSAWTYEISRDISNADAILVKRSGGSQNGWFWGITGVENPCCNGEGKLLYVVSGGLDPNAFSFQEIPLNSWHHVSIVYYKDSSTVKMYIDGVLEETKGGIPSPNPDTISDLFIGKDSIEVGDRYYFHGMIDDIRIYSRALSDAEIQELYLNTNASCVEVINEVTIDIKPGSCPNPINPKSKGVLPVAIVGTESFDVNDIDTDTILLEGVAPLRWAVTDVATPFTGELCDCHEEYGDGITDLVLNFNTQEIVAAMGLVDPGDEVSLTLSATLIDGTVIEVSDCVVVVGGKK